MSQTFDPKFITFDCYGTLVWFQINQVTREVLADRLPPDPTEFLATFKWYRFDEVLGDWKPYRQVIRDALRRALRWHGIAYDEAAADRIYEAIGTWGPHPDVPAALARLATRYPLVILSNAADDQIPANVARLGAPFHAVLTAEQARAYKPRLAAFEFLLERLAVRPDEIVHVSSSLRYDLIPAHDLGIRRTVYVNRGYEPSVPAYGYREITSLAELPALFGLPSDEPVGAASRRSA
ncbi:MAG TPA: haloacid dehalogenase type II [Candidatus Limnocylindrales bacterium]|nr:haloacid dehalogenase type II [Candidatus Limnocylindrales bacterium]